MNPGKVSQASLTDDRLRLSLTSQGQAQALTPWDSMGMRMRILLFFSKTSEEQTFCSLCGLVKQDEPEKSMTVVNPNNYFLSIGLKHGGATGQGKEGEGISHLN